VDRTGKNMKQIKCFFYGHDHELVDTYRKCAWQYAEGTVRIMISFYRCKCCGKRIGKVGRALDKMHSAASSYIDRWQTAGVLPGGEVAKEKPKAELYSIDGGKL
jgi:hypothetical protein